MGIERQTTRTHWSDDETDLLLELRAKGLTVEACTPILRRSYNSCIGRLRLLRRLEKELPDKKTILEDVSEIYRLATSKSWRLE